jgi:ubiquinone/menaquinone biosynthesis C-methylase UbiE
MLQLGREKSDRALPLNADALELPFNGVFDGATVGFGVRNLADLDQGLAEAARVLKRGQVRDPGIHDPAARTDAFLVLLLSGECFR